MKIQAYDAYSQIASGNRINSASKDPAGLAISEKLNSQIKGDQKGIQNIESSQDLLNVADGSLNSILDDLGRIRELAVQAGNGMYSADDKSIIQNEINSLFKNIQDNVQNTEFNTKKLIDGSFTEQQLGVGANGQGTQMTLQDSSLEALGLDGFSVKENFDISDIDKAISKVTESLSEIGAKTNGLESNLNTTRVSEINQTAAKSSIADLDIAKAITNLNKQNVLDQYKMSMQKQQAEQQQQQLGLLI
ncbi:MAG: flagellin [Clostridiales bacterium]|nr:flagellin [Clostridiales bacterium]